MTTPDDNLKKRIIGLTALAAAYCVTLENAREAERDDFIKSMTDYLPRLYWEFSDIDSADDGLTGPVYFQSYVDEDYYESIRHNIGMLLGADDTFLETFEEDMKYSDTPIAASVSESLADIFQPLFNFISAVKDSDGEAAVPAFRECKENFEAYWAQTLCNVMRPLNHMRYNQQPGS